MSKLKLKDQVRSLIADNEEIGKCQWFIDLENSGKLVTLLESHKITLILFTAMHKT